MGGVFEEICKQYLWALAARGEGAFSFLDLGQWWGNEKVDVGVLDTLIERSQLFHYTQNHYYLFAKTGFTAGCIEKAKTISNMHLVTFDEMINHFS